MKKLLILLFVLFLLVTGCGTQESSQNKREISQVTSMVCTMTEEKEEEIKTYSITLDFYEGKLMTKTDVFTWKNSKKESCDFYKKREEVYNEMSGVSDHVSCNDVEGTRTTVYTMSALVPSEVKLAESRYVREDGSFDYSSYKTYRQNEGYRCVENH